MDLDNDPVGQRPPSDASLEHSERARARIAALIGLLDDDSPEVLQAASKEIERLGRRVRPHLRRACASDAPRLRARARKLELELQRAEVLRRLQRHACRPQIDLERALFLLARLETPDFDARPYLRMLDAMGDEVRERAAAEEDDFTRPMVLTEYLGEELGYVGSEVEYDHPDNVHIHRALERKRGMPLTLSAIYLFVARRAGIRAAPIPMPGHVLLRLYSGTRSLLIDPFDGGRIRRRADCVRYLAQHDLVPSPNWFRDASDAAMFQRHLLNLTRSAQVRGWVRSSRELYRAARILGRIQAALAESPHPA